MLLHLEQGLLQCRIQVVLLEAITVNYNDYVSVGTGRYTFTFTFTSTAAISAGRPFWIYGTNNLNVGWGNAMFTILLEEQ